MQRSPSKTCYAVLPADPVATSLQPLAVTRNPALSEPSPLLVEASPAAPRPNVLSGSSPPQVEIRILGPLDVRLRGVPFNSLRTQRVKTLLAFLAYHLDTPQERGTLMELLWPLQSTTEDMRQTLSRLRKVLKLANLSNLLQAGRQTLCLHGSPVLCSDLSAIRAYLSRWQQHCGRHRGELGQAPDRQLCSQCQLSIEQALLLYRGELFEDVQMDYSEELIRWQQNAREGLRQELLLSLHRLITSQLSAGETDRAEQNIERLLQLEPFDEEGVRLYLSLQVRRGGHSAAKAYYEKWIRRLKQEVGTIPEPATRTLMARLLQEDPAQLRGAPHLRLASNSHAANPSRAFTREAVVGPRPPVNAEGPPSSSRVINVPPAAPLSGDTTDLIEHIISLLGLPDCRMLTLYDVRDPNVRTWLSLLLERLHSTAHGQVLILEPDAHRTPQSYGQQLETLLPSAAAPWHVAHRIGFRELSAGTRADHTELLSRTTRQEPTLLIQLDLEPERLDLNPLLERLHAHQQLRVLSLSSGPLRVQVEHRLPLKQFV